MLAALGIPAICQSPITLTQANFPPATTTVPIEDVTSQITSAPAVGANQTWDYSTLTTGTAYTNQYVAVSGDAHFPTAQFMLASYFKNLTSTLGYYYDQYYAITSTGAYVVGIHVPAQNYGIGALTGNNADTLYILDNVINYAPSPDRTVFTFPTTAGSSVNVNQRHVVNMQLSVSSASLNRTPMQQAFYLNRTDSIVGWGTLKLPAHAGFNSNIPVLQDKVYQYFIDSFYLGGSPAPQTITGPFGITQGQTTGSVHRMAFYRAGEFNYQMFINFSDAAYSMVAAAYVDDNLPVATGISDLTADSWSAAYPNPMHGETFDIHIDAATTVSAVIQSDLSGRTISEIATNNKSGIVHVQTEKPLSDGLYLYRLIDADGHVISTGRIVSAK
jgi:methionine-rich copper-binding protein CopC